MGTEADEPSAVAPEPTVQVVLQGQRMGILQPAADYLAELDHAAREGRLCPQDVEGIVSLSLAGVAAITDEIEEAGETELIDAMGYEAESEVLLDALGLPGSVADSPWQPHVQVGAMEPQRRDWLRRRVGALELAHLAERP